MIITIVVVGSIGYFAFNSSSNTKPTTTNNPPTTVINCSPKTSSVCQQVTVAHDVSLLIPFASAQSGSSVPITASVPSSDGTVSSYFFNFGDGTNTTQSGATADHVYSAPGNYIVSALATINGQKHDSYQHLAPIAITSSFTSANAADVPGVSGTVTANNSQTTGVPPTAILQPGGWVAVSGAYTGQPTNPDYVANAPTIITQTGGTISGATSTAAQASAQVAFSSSGTYWVSFEGSATSVTSGATVFQNYTFTVFVAPTGIHAAAAGSAVAVSKHTGLIVYEDAPGGSTSEDPALDYETLGYEPILNVYQTLIGYNGSTTGPAPNDFVPIVAACVPGSTSGANNCQALFPNEAAGETALVNGYNYTFVISSAPQFYDHANNAHWGIYPTDVVFSLARTMGFAVQPCFGCNNGWIITQALLPTGNGSWDGGVHGARNNTPLDVFNSMTINGTDCPASAMAAPYNGCVTFSANGGGLSWPYFLELIADGLGSSIVPCGWFSASAQGAGIPGWNPDSGSSDHGDHPCAAPPAASSFAPTAWDTWEHDGSAPPYVGMVQWNMVGSGPYYMNQISVGSSYDLQANPAYASNPLCTWQGCWPAAGTYAPSVSVTWELNQIPGEEAYQSGVADFATIPSTDTGLLLQLVQQGKIKTVAFPSISIDFFPFNFAFNVAGAQKYTQNPITVASDVFSYVGLRQFVVHAYPYQTVAQTINTLDGIQYAFNYGGAIPQFMANYYPQNVSWPSGNPDTNPNDVGGAAWWWVQASQNTTSPYYDHELAGCTSSNPCQFPLFGETGAPALDERINDWASEINSLSGGALRANPLDINFLDSVINSLYSPPYGNAMPLFRLGWAPDYPDPTDYMTPLYLPDASYTAADTVNEQAQLSQFNNSGCHNAGDWTWWSNYAQTNGGVPTNCQGAAYSAMVIAMKQAAVMPVGPQRVLAYNEIEQIANALALYVYSFQVNAVASYAAWIDGTSINSNVTIGGGADQLFFQDTGNGIV